MVPISYLDRAHLLSCSCYFRVSFYREKPAVHPEAHLAPASLVARSLTSYVFFFFFPPQQVVYKEIIEVDSFKSEHTYGTGPESNISVMTAC